jgi:hypothetical protein
MVLTLPRLEKNPPKIWKRKLKVPPLFLRLVKLVTLVKRSELPLAFARGLPADIVKSKYAKHFYGKTPKT